MSSLPAMILSSSKPVCGVAMTVSWVPSVTFAKSLAPSIFAVPPSPVTSVTAKVFLGSGVMGFFLKETWTLVACLTTNCLLVVMSSLPAMILSSSKPICGVAMTVSWVPSVTFAKSLAPSIFAVPPSPVTSVTAKVSAIPSYSSWLSLRTFQLRERAFATSAFVASLS